MTFDPRSYGSAVASILHLDADGHRLMPLTAGGGASEHARTTIREAGVRQEPDAWNSAYWFRQVGAHAIYPALRDAAAEIGFDAGPPWKPEAFVEFCERARQSPGSEAERQAREVQRAEWQLLFDHCARV